jgi:UPF0716 protein FxsA
MFARLFLLFITVPLIELFLFLVIGQKIGILPTFAIILLTGVLGATLARSQGLKVLAKYQQSIAQGKLPHEAVIDGLLILIAGALLLTPGFLTDTMGFLLLAPPVRQIVRARLEASLRDRFRVVGFPQAAGFSSAAAGPSPGSARPRQATVGRDGVINVEAVVVESHADRAD